ncbi:MAG: DUF3833 family protein [Methylobacterium mesophilicum]|nr:DUF3833 family protein [Methylobacterium mesophilicum]
MRALGWLSIAVLLSLCGSAAAEDSRPTATAWPLTFFSGKSEGNGELRILFSQAKPFQVQSSGRVRRDGALVLQQTIRIAGEKPTRREWLLKRAAGDRYVGTLTEAAGPVTGEVSGNRLVLRYTMKSALHPRIRQVLTLQPDGRTVANELQATRFGLLIASVRETIQRVR